MGILRVSHVNLRVLDIDAAVAHYESILGLTVTERLGDGRVAMKCWDEWDAYSVLLSPSDRAGLDHVAFKVASDACLDALAERIAAYGIEVRTLAAGDVPLCGRALAFALPSGHEVRLLADKAVAGTAVGNTNPDPWPDGLRGIGVHWLDHLALVCECDPANGVNRVADNAKFLVDILDFKLTERGVAGPDGSVLVAAFLARTNTPHDIALVPGPSSGLHHVAFYLDDWNAVLRAADIAAKAGLQPSQTPTRHGMTRGVTYYLFDPSGNRNETFGGLGYLSQPDRPLVTWTEDKIDRGLFFLGGQNQSFLDVYT